MSYVTNKALQNESLSLFHHEIRVVNEVIKLREVSWGKQVAATENGTTR